VELKCPYAGVVSQIWRRSGEALQAGEALITVAQAAPTEVVAYVKEKQIGQVSENLRVELVKSNRPEQVAVSQVVYVGPVMELMPERLWQNPNLPQYGLPVLIRRSLSWPFRFLAFSMIGVPLLRSWICLATFLAVCMMFGCGRHNYKEEADEQVYEIIDRKWRADYGPKVNYKISDTEPLPEDIRIERSVPESGILGLPRAVALATAYNREYQFQKEELYIRALDLRLVRHDYEKQFFGGLSGGYNADRNDEVVGLETNFGFNQLLATGAKIGTEVALAWAQVLTGNLESGLVSVLSTSVTQPLLRGKDRMVVFEDLTQAERDTLYQVRTFNRFRKTLVVSVIAQYYQVLGLYETAEIAKSYYHQLSDIYGRVETLTEAGRLPKFELDRAQQDRLVAYDAYVQARKAYEQALDELKIALAMRTTTEFELDASELEALKAAGMASPEFPEDEAVETAFAQRLDLANSIDGIEDAERKVLVAADGLRADANIVAVVNAISNRQANRRTLGWLREEYEIGIEIDLPIDRVAEQNVYRKALIALSQKAREYGLARDTVALEVRRAYRDLTEAAKRYEVQTESVEAAKTRLEKTQLMIRYGRASSRRVLNARRDLFDAQLAGTEALVNYNIATLNFYRDTGVLQVRPDGMWEYPTALEQSPLAASSSSVSAQ
jgi:outer membrane protein TolC